MARNGEHAKDLEERERTASLSGHATLMAQIKPSDDCLHCGEELQEHRRQWGCCIHCARRQEERLRGGVR